MTPGRKLEIAVLKAYWEEVFDLHQAAAETLSNHKAGTVSRDRAMALLDQIKHNTELRRIEGAIRKLESAE